MATDDSKKSSKKTGGEMSPQDTEKMMLILSYISILALIPYFSAKDSKVIRFHARQGVALAIIWVALMFINSMFASLWFFGLYALFAMISNVVYLGLFALSIWGIINATSKKEVKLPIASQLADALKL